MNIILNKYFKPLIIIVLLFSFNFSLNAQRLNDKFVLVLDAGHGGKDPGTHGVSDREKVIALDITLKLGKLIKDYYGKDVKVIYTRKDDTFVELAERANIANRNHADFFISIHCNAGRSSAYGTETFVLGSDPKRANSNFSIVKKENSVILLEDNHKETYEGFDPSSPESLIGLTLMQNTHLDNSLKFAYNVEKNFVEKDKRRSRGVKQAGFIVLWRTATPSVLIETGFISNPKEGNLLASEKGQKATAESIFNAFKLYKKDWDAKRGYSKNYSPKPIPKETPKPVVKEKPMTDLLYKIQFLTSKRKYRSNAPQLKGLKNVQIVKVDNVYKYYYGVTAYQSKRDKNLAFVKKKGFPDAFVVEIPKKKETAPTTSATAKNNTVYRIQIMSSRKNYSSNSPLMKGLHDVKKIKEKTLYKYCYGSYKTEQEAQKSLKYIKKSKFPDAFIVKFVNGVKQ